MESIDFKIINKPLKELTHTFINNLHKEPQNRIAQNLSLICELFMRVADNNYNAIVCLVTKDYRYSPTAKIICRSTMDMLYTLCLILSKPDKYVSLYMKSGWREKFETLLLEKESDYMKAYGVDWLKEYELFVESASNVIGLTEEVVYRVQRIRGYCIVSQ